MRRRTFIAGLGSAAAWPLVARAQQPALPVIGFLSFQSANDELKNVNVPFLRGLKEMGYVEAQNVAVEYLYAENQLDRLPVLAADLVHRRVAVIVTSSTPVAVAAKVATTTIPIVIATADDPVALGLVASLNRPGANVTGIVNLGAELAPKRLQLLRELIPNPTLFGVLVDPAYPATPSTIAELQVGAHSLGLQLLVFNARTDGDLETAFATFSKARVGAVLVGRSAFYSRRTEQLAALAARHALPAIFPLREYALAGGLICYGSSLGYVWHQTGIYTGRILKGDKPADLPVAQITKIELVINLKTAKALGLTIPETLLEPSEGDVDRMPALATDLVRRHVTIIVAMGLRVAQAAKAATQTIPIVFGVAPDPVAFGVVPNLNRTSGNLTGVISVGVELAGKRLELLHKLVPAADPIAILTRTAGPGGQAETRAAQSAAGVLGVRLLALVAETKSEVAAAFATLVEQHAGALLIAAQVFPSGAYDKIISLAGRYAVPTLFSTRALVARGALASYGSQPSEFFRQMGVYTGRILKGEKPADLPVVQPTKFELVINLKTAKALGLTIPETLLATADEVIQ